MEMRSAAAVLLLLCSVVYATKYELLPYESKADPSAVVVTSNGMARFTVLTPRMLRMEQTKAAFLFEDRPTITFVNRKLPVPSFSAHETAGILTITTEDLQLTYKLGAGFSAESLQVVSVNAASAFKSWNGDMRSEHDTGNLMGTFRTLDGTANVALNCSVNQKDHCVYGLVSRSGWAVVDDVGSPLLDEDDWWTDDAAQPYEHKSSVDLYLLAHGLDYKGALKDYTSVAGRIPIFPRYASGVWYTRWYDYNNIDTRFEVAQYAQRGMPLDVWVYDMNFHKKNDWTGYTFDPALFPYPADTLEFLHNAGLHTAANLHDASGVGSWEDQFNNLCNALGLDASKTSTVDFNLMNKTMANALDDVVLQALEKQGMDFWWIDWQQGEKGGHVPGGQMNPTIWLDKMRVTDPQRRGSNQRGLVLARFGGLGNHRYQVGFSGDVQDLSWTNLAYQPYFSASASNVGYGFWSHDIEGPGSDHEMYARWVQWGAMSGIMRSHERGMSAGGCKNPFPTRDVDEDRCSTVEVWNSPRAYYDAMRQALVSREQLIPYIYTQTRVAYDTGVSIIRPLYYDYPHDETAYLSNENGRLPQYMFGDDIMVAPAVTPSDNTTMTNMTIYLPEGVWVERDTGRVRVGPQWVNKYVDLMEVPTFVRGGAVVPSMPVPMGDSIGLAQRQYSTLEFAIYPGESAGSTRVYEDDGLTTDYATKDAYAWTTASYTRTPQDMKVTISTQGSFPELPTSRSYNLYIINALPLQSVVLNGKPLRFARWGGQGTWRFCGDGMAVVVQGFPVTVNDQTDFILHFAAEVTVDTLNGAKGLVQHAVWAKRNLDETRDTPGSETVQPAYCSHLASTGDALAYLANKDLQTFLDIASNLTNMAQAAIEEVSKLLIPPVPETFLTQMYDTNRKDHVLCGTTKCRTVNQAYHTVRNEGYQPLPTHPNAIKLNDYWDTFHDNYATTLPTPHGYEIAGFEDGYVLSVQEAGTIPLYCMYNEAIGDHMTLADEAAIADAKKNGYAVCKELGVVGYIFTKDPAPPRLGEVDHTRVYYSLALLESALV